MTIKSNKDFIERFEKVESGLSVIWDVISEINIVYDEISDIRERVSKIENNK